MFAVIAGFAFAAIAFCAIHAATQRKFSPFGWYSLMSLGVFLIAGTLAIRVGLPDPAIHEALRRFSLLGCIPYLAGMLYIYHDRLGSRTSLFDKLLLSATTIAFTYAAISPLWLPAPPAVEVTQIATWAGEFYYPAAQSNPAFVTTAVGLGAILGIRCGLIAWPLIWRDRLGAVLLLGLSAIILFTALYHLTLNQYWDLGIPVAPITLACIYVVLGFEIVRHDHQLVSEQKRGQRIAHERIERFRQFFLGCRDGIAVIDSRCRAADVNPAMAEIHGYSPEQFLALEPLAHVHSDSRGVYQQLQSAVDSERVFHAEATHLKKDGTPIEVELYATSMHPDEMGDHALLFVRDVSARKLAEAQLEDQQLMLVHASRLSTMGEMLAGIAHEINQPLYSIANLAAACKNGIELSDYQGELPLGPWLQQISDEAVRCGDIIRGLRTFARKHEGPPEPVELRKVVRDSVALLESDERWRNMPIECRLPDEPLVVQGSEVQLQQVIVNLLRNAFDAMQGSASPKVVVDAHAEHRSVVVRISDNGPGIDPKDANKLFQTFYTTKSDGMGIGLSISRSIVEASGGTLELDEPVLSGATFRLELPIPQPVPAAAS